MTNHFSTTYIKIFTACFLLGGIFVITAHGQKSQRKAIIPSDEEIKLLATQAGQAMKDLEADLNQAKHVLGDNGAFDEDKKVLKGWAMAGELLESRPQAFNSVVGFNIVTILDDASRNAAILASGATLQVAKNLTAGRVQDSPVLMTLASNANNTSQLLYTVSENATALYERYLNWQEQTTTGLLKKCGDALKQKTPARN